MTIEVVFSSVPHRLPASPPALKDVRQCARYYACGCEGVGLCVNGVACG